MKIQPWLRKSLNSRLPETGRMKWRKYLCTCPALVLSLSIRYGMVRDRIWSRWPLSLTQHCCSCSLALFQLSWFTPWLLGGCISSCPAVMCSSRYLAEKIVSASKGRPLLGPSQRGISFWTQRPELRNLILWSQESWYVAAKQKQWQELKSSQSWGCCGQTSTGYHITLAGPHWGVGNSTQIHFFWDRSHLQPVPHRVGIQMCKGFWIHALLRS